MSTVTIAYDASAAEEVDLLEAHLTSRGYRVSRLGCSNAGSRLAERLLSVRGPLFLLVNDGLLHSRACLTGLLGAYEQLETRDDFHPVMASTYRRGPGAATARVMTSLARVSDVIRYMNYWQSAYLTRRRDLGSSASTTGAEELASLRRISQDIGPVLRRVRAADPRDVRSLIEAEDGLLHELLGVPPEVVRSVNDNEDAMASPAALASAAVAAGAVAKTDINGDKHSANLVGELTSESVDDGAPTDHKVPDDEVEANDSNADTTQSPVAEIVRASSSTTPQPTPEAPAASVSASEPDEGDASASEVAVVVSEPALAEMVSPSTDAKSDPASPGESPPVKPMDGVASNAVGASENSPGGAGPPMAPPGPASAVDLPEVAKPRNTAPNNGIAAPSPQTEGVSPEPVAAIAQDFAGRSDSADRPDIEGEEAQERPGGTEGSGRSNAEALDEAALAKLQRKARNLTRRRNLKTFLALRARDGFESSSEFARAALAEDEGDDRLRYAFAVALLEHAERTEETVEELREVIAPLLGTSLAAHAHLCLGQLALRRRDYGSARLHLRKAYRLNRDADPELPYRLGALLQDEFEDERPKAAKYLRRAAKKSRANRGDANYRLGLVEWDAGRLRRAVRHFKLALSLEAEHPFAAYDLAVLYRERNRPLRARAYFERALRTNPELDTPANQKAFTRTGPDGEPATLPETRTDKFLDFVRDRGTDAGTSLAAVGDDSGEASPLAISRPSLTTIDSEDLDQRELPESTEGDSEQSAPAADERNHRDHEIGSSQDTGDSAVAALKTAAESIQSALRSMRQEPIDMDALSRTSRSGKGALTVLITGASSGIGKATAACFAKAGHRLILTGRRVDRLLELSNDLKRTYGVAVRLLSFDVSDYATAERMVTSLEGDWASVDVLVNNAGKARGLKPVHQMAPDEIDDMVDTNVKGLLYMTRLIGARMAQNSAGHIINVCSTAGHEVYAGGTVYCATKHAVDAITRGTRLDLFRQGVRVSQVSPAAVEETEFSRVRFDGDDERAAEVYEGWQPLRASDVAEQIVALATAPAHVNVQDVIMLGTQQANSTNVDKSGRERYAKPEG